MRRFGASGNGQAERLEAEEEAASRDAGGAQVQPQVVGRRAQPEAAIETSSSEAVSAPQGPRMEAPGRAQAAPPPARLPAEVDSEVDSESDSEQGVHEDARHRRAAWLALLALALLSLGGPAAAYLVRSRPCWRSDDGMSSGREDWADNWQLYAVCAPESLAFAAWCVAVRRRSRPVPLHAWTRRFGACGVVYAAGLFAKSLLDPGCHGGAAVAAWQGVGKALYSGAYAGTVVIPYHLIALKLRALGAHRQARAARAAVRAGAAAVAAFVVAWSVSTGLVALGSGGGPVLAALAWVRDTGILVAMLATVPTTCCVAWGLLDAARALRSGPAGMALAARWLHWTAVLVLASLLLLGVDFVFLYGALTGVADGFDWWVHARASANVVNSTFNCLQVAFLSGLVGPRWLQRLAVQAFKSINSYSAEELQRRYEEFLAYLDEAEIKWVRCRYLRQMASTGSILVRCQAVPTAEAVVGSEGLLSSRDAPKHRYAVSHPWLSKAHPDPSGEKLQALVDQLDLLDASDNDVVFIDYTGLPQHDHQDSDLQRLERNGKWPKPGRHPAVRDEGEELLFKRALNSMEMMYSIGGIPVIVLPMDSDTAEGRGYFSRGWCFLEFCLVFSFGNIANAEIHPSVKSLCDTAKALELDTVEGFRKAFRQRQFTASGDRRVVLRLFRQTLKKINITSWT